VSLAAGLLSRKVSPGFLWEISAAGLGLYLVFHPALACPTSLGVALGGGLFLFLFRSIPEGALARIGLPTFLFLLYLIVDSIFSLNPGLSWQALGFVFLGVLLYLMALEGSAEAKGRFEIFALGLAVLAAGMGMDQWLFGFQRWASLLPGLSGGDYRAVYNAVEGKRAFGPFVTSGSLAALLILLIPVGAIQAQIQSGFKRVLFFLVTGFLVLGLLATQSVGACLCLALAVFLVLVYRGSWKWALAAALACAAGIGLILAVRGWHNWHLASYSMRLSLWESCWNLFLIHPFLGSGPGTFDLAYRQAGMPLDSGSRFAHNLFFQTLVEEGAIGVLLAGAALARLFARIKAPARWEGWGVLTGALAFFLFSFLDLPFEMPELVWVFALLAGRLEVRSGREIPLPRLNPACFQWGLLAILLIAGFWPPFRPWNFALLAGAIWAGIALFQRKFTNVSLWVFLGAFYFGLRAFVSPSALGTVHFLETAGLVAAFWLLVRAEPFGEPFLKKFCLLGLVWGASAWVVSLMPESPTNSWDAFPNPKDLAVFLIPAFFFAWPERWNQWKPAALSFLYIATMIRLKAVGALAGVVAGLFFLKGWSARFRWPAAGLLLLLALGLRWMDSNETQWDRFIIWKAALKVWAWNPVLGVGPGVFVDAFHQVKDPRIQGFSRYLMDARFAHNELLDFLTAFGLIGLVFLLGGLAAWWKTLPTDRAKASAAGIGTASFFDFCLHTPLILLQTAALALKGKPEKSTLSWPAGFLALGLVLGLFGGAAWVPVLRHQAQAFEAQQQLPPTLDCLKSAEQLNAWDSQNAWETTQFTHQLYLATGDPNWRQKTDEGLNRMLALEPLRGEWLWDKARLLSERVAKEGTAESAQAALDAWHQADVALPDSAFLKYEEGVYFFKIHDLNDSAQCFRRAVDLEPRYAVAWMNLGMVLKAEGQKEEAREDLRQAAALMEEWRGKNLDPVERPMVDVPDEVLKQLKAAGN